MNFDSQNNEGLGENSSGTRLIPRITIQAFCDHSQTAELIENSVHDRRMSRVALTTHNGGLEAAIATYKDGPTPNLIVVEISSGAEEAVSSIQRLAEVCDSGTNLIVLGHVNDVVLYRELKNIGVSEYLVLPVKNKMLIDSIAEIFATEDGSPIGRSVAFIGAKGGAGSSSIAHNVAWAVSHDIMHDALIIDMDLAFGTCGLDFNQDPPKGLGDAVFASDNVDAIMIDRLMSKVANHLNLLASPVKLDRTYDFNERVFEQIIELSQQIVPIVILDVPHIWSAWAKHTLSMVDEVVLVAEPDLANLRNAKNIIDSLRNLRPEENAPKLIVNKIGMPKRPEIAPQEFSDSVGCELFGEILFDAATFGSASNNGQMIVEISQNHKANEVFRNLANDIMGRNISTAEGKAKALGIPMLMKLLKRA